MEVKQRGVSVELITSNHNTDYALKSLISYDSPSIQNLNNFLINLLFIIRELSILLLIICFFILVAVYSYIYDVNSNIEVVNLENIQILLNQNILFFYSFITSVISLSILIFLGIVNKFTNIFTKVNKNKRINYKWRFPVSIYKKERDKKFIHAKLFIIDDHIAYLGSLNFTTSALEPNSYNYESRIHITDKSTVRELNKEFEYLKNNKFDLSKVDFEEV